MNKLSSCFCEYFKNICSALANRRKHLMQKRRLLVLRQLDGEP